MPNKRTGQDYQDYQKKKKAKSKSPKMGSAEGWADLRSRIKKDKEKQKKNRKNLPHKI